MLRDIVVNLLHNLGGRSEVDRYLSEYAEGKRCTVVKVGGGLIQDDLEELASALALLHHVGLRPVVIHGAGPQLTAEMESAGIEPEWHDGLRVTTPKVLAAATKVFGEVGTELADALEAKGVRTRRLTNGVFHATPTETPGLGLVGEITGLDGEAIATAIERDRMPIIAPIGTTEDGQLLNVNADTAARAMATWRRSQKVIFLTPTGGILNPHGKVIPAVNCEQDLDEMLLDGTINGGMARKLIEIRDLLSELDVDASVSITSPAKVARELFTHQGSGTLVRMGTPIVDLKGGGQLDQAKTTTLLERSFGKTLKDGFFDRLGDADVHLGGDYTAIAIVRSTTIGVDYLDKLALGPEAQGIGLGASMWNRLREQHPKMFWRSKPTNPVNKWYLSRADGMHRDGEWLVFWYGLENHEEINACIAEALGQEATFHEPEPAHV
jgi:acetylglutamate kinase